MFIPVIYEIETTDNGLVEASAMESCSSLENDVLPTLHESMVTLFQQLESGEATMQFEVQYYIGMLFGF